MNISPELRVIVDTQRGGGTFDILTLPREGGVVEMTITLPVGVQPSTLEAEAFIRAAAAQLAEQINLQLRVRASYRTLQ